VVRKKEEEGERGGKGVRQNKRQKLISPFSLKLFFILFLPTTQEPFNKSMNCLKSSKG